MHITVLDTDDVWAPPAYDGEHYKAHTQLQPGLYDVSNHAELMLIVERTASILVTPVMPRVATKAVEKALLGATREALSEALLAKTLVLEESSGPAPGTVEHSRELAAAVIAAGLIRDDSAVQAEALESAAGAASTCDVGLPGPDAHEAATEWLLNRAKAVRAGEAA